MANTTLSFDPRFELLWYGVGSGLGSVGAVCSFFNQAFPNPEAVLVMGEWLMAVGAAGLLAIVTAQAWLRNLKRDLTNRQ